MKNRKIRFKFLLLVGFLVFSFSGNAQVTTSNIKGLILDDVKEPLPGVNIVAVHTPTGTKYGGITNFDGRYNLMNMRVGGPYSVTVSYVGFTTQEITDVFLTLGKTFTLDTQMTAGGEQLDGVVVTASSGSNTFGNDRTGSETSVGKRELATLPTISRSASDFTRLEPSASGGSFGGSNSRLNNFSLDGSIFNNPFGLDASTPGGQANAQPVSLDAIDQIQVATAPYDVTLSGFTGASVNAVTKSGTNDFHGTVYGFYRNNDLTGQKIDGDKLPEAKLLQQQYGLSIGGPIIKNKLFFFANFEKDDRQDLGTAWIANRGTGVSNESRVLASDLEVVSGALSELGYDTGVYEGYIHDTKSTKGIFKLDWNINDNHRLALIYNFLNASRELPAHPSSIFSRGPSATTLQFESSGYKINNKLNSYLIELNSTLSPNITNKLQVGHSLFDDFRNPFSAPAPPITITRDGAPYIIAGHEPFSIHNELKQKVYQITNNLNIASGNHTYTIGLSFEKFEFDNSFNLKGYGFDVFASEAIDPFINNGVLDSNAFTQFLGDRYGQGIEDAQNTFNTRNSLIDGADGGWLLNEVNVGQLSFYLQDEWNASERFKLTYGVRFDKPSYFNTSDKAQEFIDADNGELYLPEISYFNPDNGEEVFFDSTKMPNTNFLISPRIGFNWDVKGDDTLQLRGGSGIFTGRLPFVWIGNQVSGVDAFFYQVIDPDFKFPQVWRTSLGIDHRLENGITGSLDLSYSKNINGIHVQNWGLNKPTATLQGVDNRLTYVAAERAQLFGNPTSAYVLTNTDKGGIFNTSLKLKKNFKNGLRTTLAYNFLDAKDVNSIEAEISGDAFNGNASIGNVNADVLSNSKYGDKHRIIGTASKKWVYGNDKWSTTFTTFFEYAQGGRHSYTYNGDINGDGSRINDLVYVPTISEVNQMQFSGAGQSTAFESYIQQDDYLSQNRGNYTKRYAAISPWRSRWDMKFIQELKVSNLSRVQFSVDMLNFGNLLNSGWGLTEIPKTIRPISVTVDPNNVPTYTYDSSLTQTYGFDSSLNSRWQMQFGLRYIF